MTGSPFAVSGSDRPLPERMVTLIKNLPQRVHEREFWITQAGVLGVTTAHILAEMWAAQSGLDIPSAFHHIPVILYLGPISYASLRLGTEGAVLTGLWSAALTIPNVLIWHRADFEWLEVFYVAVVILVGVIMSVPVERERQQRRRAESTSQRLALLDDIATLTLKADLRYTLDETLIRLLDMLNLEAACVAVANPADPEAELSVLGCHPMDDPAGDVLTACLKEQQRRAEHGPSAVPGLGIVVVPLTADLPGSGPEGRVSGLMVVKTRSGRSLTDDDHQLLAGVASHLAVAIANERLTESERNRLRSYAMLMTQAQEEERKRIARELHDEASQNVVVIRRRIAALAASLDDHPAAVTLVELSDLAGQTVAEMRRFSRDLRPPTLDELGLSSALEQLATQVSERSALAVEFRATGRSRRLSIETELAVFRIGQAGLHNVERHAAANAVTIELTFEPDRVRLEVTDDGRGFEPPQNLAELPEAGKLGLIGMHERTQLVGGTLQILSRPNAGTRILLEVPG
ncbi:MAG: GAF domain-containing sensor histidine kinase [Acidimicrobiia bacterium]